jgi:nicotinate-nucleotide pyrophosphorylase (carboxylating)
MSLAESLRELVLMAKQEDLGHGDLTTSLLDEPLRPAEFRLIAKESCVFAGRDVAAVVLQAYDPTIEIDWTDSGVDGQLIRPVAPGPWAHLATLRGPLASLLAAERVLLNFLQRLSGVATKTRLFVDAVAGTNAAICDTRKTTPGWRDLEKYAVRCGGGINHRRGLFDAVLIKDNHVQDVPVARLASTVFEMLNRLEANMARSGGEKPFVQVEADSLDQVEELFKVMGIDAILLDNFPPDKLRQAVEKRDGLGLRGKVLLEASGGVTLDTVRNVAETGVDRISVGALTHSAVAADLSLERVR